MDVKRDAQSPNPSLLTLLTQLPKVINKRMSEDLLGMRIKPYVVLGYIRDHEGVSQQELESAMYMDANGVVLLLNELEAARHLVRRRDPQDRRRHIVEITDSGRRALERADRAREGLEDEILAALSAEDRQTLRRLVERVIESLVQPAAEART
ncbi:MAG: MarR family transcriptional regulator [Chloroflexi bacterium]|nr:MAG: MarR family transcriptional regulator [Chloroflexota bacterium]